MDDEWWMMNDASMITRNDHSQRQVTVVTEPEVQYEIQWSNSDLGAIQKM